MRPSRITIPFAILCACGPAPRPSEDNNGVAPDAPTAPEIDAAVEEVLPDASNSACKQPSSGGQCETLNFSFSTQQACTIGVLPGAQIDGEGFITVDGTDHRVLALNRLGAGHVIGWCDGTTTRELLQHQVLVKYLGQMQAPRVASFGRSVLCQPGANPSSIEPNQATYLGESLPAQYVGDPAKLAQDWDVVVYCGLYEWSTDWSSTLEPYVSCYGKGVLGVMDYRDSAQQASDFDNINVLMAPAGFKFEPTSIDWASGSGQFAECVPDVIL